MVKAENSGISKNLIRDSRGLDANHEDQGVRSAFIGEPVLESVLNHRRSRYSLQYPQLTYLFVSHLCEAGLLKAHLVVSVDEPWKVPSSSGSAAASPTPEEKLVV